MTMQPFIRLSDNYVEEYKRLVYNFYAPTINIVPVTYFQLDKDATIYDENYIGTFRKTGTKSGRKYNKIHLFPVAYAQQVIADMDSAERGVSTAFNTQTSITIDPISGLTPHIGDIIHFNISGDFSYWEIVNIENAGVLEKPYWKCTLTQIRIFPEFDKQIVKEFMYVEYSKKIMVLQDAINFFKLMNRLQEIIDFLNDASLYNHNIDYRQINNISFPEIENILNTHISLAPPSFSTLMGSSKKIDINMNSLLVLLTMPTLFDTDNNPIYKFSTNQLKIYNDRIRFWNIYSEYVTDEFGDLNILSLFYEDQSLNSILSDCYKFLNFLKDTSNLPDYESSTPLKDLLLEWSMFIQTVSIDEKSHIVSNNLLEAVSEYCLISDKLLVLNNKDGVVLL